MRELEPHPFHETSDRLRIAIIGAGRLGGALASALTRVPELDVDGPHGRGGDGRDADGRGADVVLLCVPDGEIAAAASLVAVGPLVGHCSGATGLDVLAPHRCFSLHPLMTVTAAGADFRGAAAALDGSDDEALAMARRLAKALGLEPVRIAAPDRGIYHAAACVAANFLVTLEAAAERLAAEAGIERRLLVPLVRAAVENWAELGGSAALTGPVARGDEATVARQREAVRDRAPELTPLFDALVAATRALAGREMEPV